MKKGKLLIDDVEIQVIMAIAELADSQFEGHMNLAIREIVEKGMLLYGKMDEMDKRITDMETFFYSHKDSIEEIVRLSSGKRKRRKRIDGSWR